MLMLDWLIMLNNRFKIAVFCSDVSGAFDRVSAKLLVKKLISHGLHARMVELLRDWLQSRRASVIVSGERSDEFEIMNQVF